MLIASATVPRAAEPPQFDDIEHYTAEGQRLEVRRVTGETTVAFVSEKTAMNAAIDWVAASGKPLHPVHELSGGAVLYRINDGQADGAQTDAEILGALVQDATVRYAYPVFVNQSTGLRMFLNDQIVVRFQEKVDPNDFADIKKAGLRLVEAVAPGENIYAFEFERPKEANPFKICEALLQNPQVLWAEPNMALEVRQFVIPNETSFSSHWHLRNTGQTSAFSDADVDADDAWGGSQGYGSPGIRIAIIDDGVETTHADLSANIVQGYDFYSGDADPNPGTYNNHGTAVAGVAAAVVNNSLGVVGTAGKCQILPIRLIDEDASGASYLPTATTIYRSLIYAAENADVINCSWGTSSSSTISSGFSYAYSSGRGGKGCVSMVASGNWASGEGVNSYSTLWSVNIYATAGLGAGNYFVGFRYGKDANASANDDCFWLADVTFPNGTKERLDSSTVPAGWSTDGNANWTTSIDPVHTHGTSRYAWRSGAVGDNQFSRLFTPLVGVSSTATTLSFRMWVSSDPNDKVFLDFFDGSGNFLGFIPVIGGSVANRNTTVSYPASLSSVLSVGASSDFDYRSDYSQYGSTLKLVAPSGGGYGTIWTTDRTGAAGNDSTDYFSGFSGTSASAPLAAGVAALVLSKDGNQTRSTVVNKLIQNTDKIGPVAYSGSPSRNDYYGYGRVNAYSSVNATTADTTAPTFNTAIVMNYRAIDLEFSEPMGEGVATPGNYTLTAGANTLSSNPAKVIRIRPTTYRLIWTSGEMVTSGTVTVQASSSIKDVAGNALTTTSRSSTGTKRVIAINCGNAYVNSGGVGTGYEPQYTPPFVSDYGFQGNESAQYLTTSSVETYYDYNQPAVNTSGVTDPAPQGVYLSNRRRWMYTSTPFSYSIPAPSGTYKVRLHFAELVLPDYYSIGLAVFDIKINGTVVASNFDILAHTNYKNIAHVEEFSGIASSGSITVEIVPKLASDSYYRASLNGIEVVKP